MYTTLRAVSQSGAHEAMNRRYALFKRRHDTTLLRPSDLPTHAAHPLSAVHPFRAVVHTLVPEPARLATNISLIVSVVDEIVVVDVKVVDVSVVEETVVDVIVRVVVVRVVDVCVVVVIVDGARD